MLPAPVHMLPGAWYAGSRHVSGSSVPPFAFGYGVVADTICAPPVRSVLMPSTSSVDVMALGGLPAAFDAAAWVISQTTASRRPAPGLKADQTRTYAWPLPCRSLTLFSTHPPLRAELLNSSKSRSLAYGLVADVAGSRTC